MVKSGSYKRNLALERLTPNKRGILGLTPAPRPLALTALLAYRRGDLQEAFSMCEKALEARIRS